MSNFLIKLKLIYLQFLIVAIGFISLYSFLIWLVVYQSSLLDLNEDLIKFWLPFVLPVIPVYIWLRPRIKLLVLKDKKGNLPLLYFFAASVAISAPTLLLQEYLFTASGKLTEIKYISEIRQKPITRYYTITHHYIDKQRAVIHRRTSISGRNNEYLTFHLYLACPILDKAPQVDSDNKIPIAWLGTEYTKGISNHCSDELKEQAFKALGREALTKLKEQNFDQFIYLDHIGNNDRHKGYDAAIKWEPQYEAAHLLILEARNEPFSARNGDKFGWVFKSFTIGAGIWLILLIFPNLDKVQLKKLPEYTLENQWESFYKFTSSIKITGKSPVFIIIIALNILIFIIMVFAGLGFISFDGQDLYTWGANYNPAIVDGQWWRLFTNIFLHGGLMHLLYNMIAMFFISIFLEPILGKAKFVIAYILYGLLASITSIWWHPATVNIGASGAIFGLYGLFIALLTTNKVDANSRKGLLINNLIFVGINLVVGFAGGIDNAAHIGGLLTGFVIGYIMYFFIEKPKPKKIYKKKIKVIESKGDLGEGESNGLKSING